MQRMSFIDVFKQDKLFINEREYNRLSFYDIAKELNLEIKEHPFFSSLHTVEFMENTLFNTEIDCLGIMIEANDNKIMDIITYPVNKATVIASCSVSMMPDIYDTPAGKMCDYVIDGTHKISIGPDGSVLYIWD